MTEQIKVSDLDKLQAGQRLLITAGGREIALFNVDGTIYAIDNTCPHSTGPLVEGRLFGVKITCPWHGAQFDITSGQCYSGPAATNVTSYPVHIIEKAIYIDVS